MMNETGIPSAHGSDGRDCTGRFTPGNRLGRGNPLAGRAAKIRAVMLEAVSAEDMREVVAQLLSKAKQGDLAAIKLLLDRTLGPPVEIDLLERLETLEKLLQERDNT